MYSSFADIYLLRDYIVVRYVSTQIMVTIGDISTRIIVADHAFTYIIFERFSPHGWSEGVILIWY